MWFLFALASYTIFASITITDKYLLSRSIPDARVYAFYTGILGVFAFVLAPFGFEIPSVKIMGLGILAGALLITTMFLFFSALAKGEALRVLVAWGGLVPIFTLSFVFLTTREFPSSAALFAFFLLLLGSVIIMFEGVQAVFRNWKTFSLVLLSSFLFGLYYTVVKFLFAEEPFINAFLWIKVGGVVWSLLFLFSPRVRCILFEHKRTLPQKAGSIFLIKNGAGGIAALLQHLAISTARFGEVAIINALQGVQFALVFLAVLFLAKRFPEIVKEKVDREVMIVKMTGTGLVIAGVALLAIN